MVRTVARAAIVTAFAAALAAGAGCAHQKAAANLSSLRSASDTFFRHMRWNDLRGASQIVVAESAKAWLDAALDAKDDENLKITEVELDDLQLKPGGGIGEVKLTWHRLPSVTAKTDRVTVEWVDRGGVWFVLAVKKGPLPLEAPPEADGGTPPPREEPKEKSPPRAL